MPSLKTAGDKRWDHTPKSWIWTTRHRVRRAPVLDNARAVQREAFDWALDVLETEPRLKVRAATGKDSLWKRLTAARASAAVQRANVTLQRAAVSQAHAAFAQREAHLAERAALALAEQSKDVSPRALRRLSKAPKPTCEYRRCHPSKRHRRQAIHVLEGVRIADGRGLVVRISGVGTVHLRDAVEASVSSAQLVEAKGELWLHVQHGRPLPEPRNPEGASLGLDCGIAHTLTGSNGIHLERPDTTALEREARALFRHRARCCTRGSRQWKRHAARARARLRNMTASARGTESAPGRHVAAKRGLNRGLAGARLAKLHTALHRRCVRDGTWAVAVDPRNTSITCSRCGHRNPASRKGQHFTCMQCAHRIHADHNAGINIERRARNVLRGYLETRGGGDRRPGAREGPNRQGHAHDPGQAATLYPLERGRSAASEDVAHGLEMTVDR